MTINLSITFAVDVEKGDILITVLPDGQTQRLGRVTGFTNVGIVVLMEGVSTTIFTHSIVAVYRNVFQSPLLK